MKFYKAENITNIKGMLDCILSEISTKQNQCFRLNGFTTVSMKQTFYKSPHSRVLTVPVPHTDVISF